MRWLLALAVMWAGAAAAQPAAQLDSWAQLPPVAVITAPVDAGRDVSMAGKFTDMDGPRRSAGAPLKRDGGALPAPGQIVQGISALRAAGEGAYWALSDNGFGAKANSADAMLMLHQVKFDWTQKTAAVVRTVFLSDPNMRAPFRIAQEGAAKRYLTGADFDPESLVVRGDGGFVVGDEFGPYLLGFDANGRLEWLVEAQADGKPVFSPDNPKATVPDAGQSSTANIGRSKGFEGLAASPDGKTLLAMMEGPIRRDGASEAGLRILEFDLAARRWTGMSWLYPLADAKHAIGEITLLGPGRALVIERDSGQGDAATACPPTTPGMMVVRPVFAGCHPQPARFKKVVLVELPEGGGAVVKRAEFDLLAIADPKRSAPSTDNAGRFSFPFLTIEAIEPLPDGRLLIANDNNYPFSDGRRPDYLDATEFIVLTPPPGFAKP